MNYNLLTQKWSFITNIVNKGLGRHENNESRYNHQFPVISIKNISHYLYAIFICRQLFFLYILNKIIFFKYKLK